MEEQPQDAPPKVERPPANQNENPNIGVNNQQVKRSRAFGIIIFAFIVVMFLIFIAISALWCKRKFKQNMARRDPLDGRPAQKEHHLNLDKEALIDNEFNTPSKLMKEGVYVQEGKEQFLVLRSNPENEVEREVEAVLNDSFGNDDSEARGKPP